MTVETSKIAGKITGKITEIAGKIAKIDKPTELDDILSESNRDSHIFLLIFISFFVVMGVWGSRFKLDIFSTAKGEVVPASQIRQVQHLEGGIIRKILVKEGDKVTVGQPLVELETTASGADVGQLRSRIAALNADQIRLNAEAAGENTLVFPANLRKGYPEIVREANGLFKARQKRHQNELMVLGARIVQRRQSIKEAVSRINRYKEKLGLLYEQIKISEKLLENELTNRYNHLDLLGKASELEGQIEEATAAATRAEFSLKEAKSMLRGSTNTFLEGVRGSLENNGRKLNEYAERLNKLEDSLKRTVLRAPVDGIVKTLRVSTRGGVIKPGESVLDIVPGEDRLIIEAKLSPGAIGYVNIGQTAKISLSAAEAMRFGDIDGTVINISPDTLVTRNGSAYYKVRIATKKTYFEKGNRRYRLYPGVVVTARIHTGQRTIIDYLFDPFLGGLKSALTEQ